MLGSYSSSGHKTTTSLNLRSMFVLYVFFLKKKEKEKRSRDMGIVLWINLKNFNYFLMVRDKMVHNF